nr:LPXTG cell wall anchor domain-containing protein [Agrococcus sp. ARC_14]
MLPQTGSEQSWILPVALVLMALGGLLLGARRVRTMR